MSANKSELDFEFEFQGYSFTFESVDYRLYLFDTTLFKLPNWLGHWLERNTDWIMRQYTGCRKRPLPSILDVPCICSNCDWSGTVWDCIPDIDGDGSLGCPECETVIEVRG